MPSILKISDGTTTVDFVSSTSGYAVSRWNPVVARRRDNLLGGRGPYQDVDEEMEITVYGTDALSKLTTLQKLMEQATRWERGENVAAVLLHYQPESTSTELKSTILGAVDMSMIELPGNFPNAPVYDYIDPIRLRFRRMGLWLGESVTATSASAAHPASLSINFTTSVDIASPVLLKLNGLTGPEDRVWNSYVLMNSGATTTEASSRLVVVNAELLEGSVAFGTSADTTNKALNGQVLRFAVQSTDVYSAANFESVNTTADTNVRRWGMYLNYRSNSTNASFRLRGAIGELYTNELPIPAGTSNPQWAFLGSIVIDRALTFINVEARGSVVGQTLDIDTIVLQAMDDETSGMIAVGSRNSSRTTFATAVPLSIDHRLLTSPVGLVKMGAVSTYNQGFAGDSTLLMRGAAVAAVWLGGGQEDDAFWRVTDTAGTAFNTTFTATRLEGHLTPE